MGHPSRKGSGRWLEVAKPFCLRFLLYHVFFFVRLFCFVILAKKKKAIDLPFGVLVLLCIHISYTVLVFGAEMDPSLQHCIYS